jgi:glycosyltransferase involved in cell wall biosynthesis
LKIVHLLSGTRAGATEQQCERLLGGLQGKGVTQHVLMTEDAARAERFRGLGLTAREIQFPGRFAFLDRRTVNGEVRKVAPEVVMSWSPRLGALIERDGHVHVGRVGKSIDAELLAACDHLIAPSQARADKTRAAGWSNERVHVLPPLVGAAAAALCGTASAKPVDRKAYFTPSTTPLVFCAAELDEDCGVDVLIKAVARLSGFYLWIAGDGPARARLEETAHELGIKPRVRFLGWQDDLTPFQAVADMMVSPGVQDDVGAAVLEGWSAGMAVIAADSLGPGLLIRQRETGVLVPVGDAVNLAEAIKWLSRDAEAARALGAAGAAAFAAQWTVEKTLPQYLALFERVCATPAVGA